MNRSSRNVLQTKTRMAPPLLRLNIHTNCGFSSFHTQCAIYIQFNLQSQHVVVSLIWWSLVFYYYYYFRENRQYVMGTRQQVRWEIVSVVRFHFHSLHWLDMQCPADIYNLRTNHLERWRRTIDVLLAINGSHINWERARGGNITWILSTYCYLWILLANKDMVI